jgi:transposase
MFQNINMGQIKLTEKERINLIATHKKNMRAKEADKIKAVLLLDKGYSHQETAEILLIDENTITNWKQDFLNSNDINKWLKDNYFGYQGKLNKEQLNQIENFVENSIIQASEQVRQYIKDQFNLTYTVQGTVNLLHNLKFVYKNTKNIPSKYNPENQERFKDFYELLEKDLPDNQAILFTDACHPQHNTEPTRVWVKKGEEKVIKSNTGRNRININGMYNPLEQDFIYTTPDTVNAEKMIELFKKTEEQYPDKEVIHVIADNARYIKNKDINNYLNDSKINLIFLPPYSPNLSLIERLWRFLRKKIIRTIYYESFSLFKTEILSFLDNINQCKKELSKFVGTKLHLLPAYSG